MGNIVGIYSIIGSCFVFTHAFQLHVKIVQVLVEEKVQGLGV